MPGGNVISKEDAQIQGRFTSPSRYHYTHKGSGSQQNLLLASGLAGVDC